MSHHLCKSPIRSRKYAGAGLLLVALMLCAGCSQEGGALSSRETLIFPSDLATYPNAKTSEPSAKGEFTRLRTSDSTKQVMEFYQDKSRNGGWEAVNAVNMGPTAARVIITKGGRTAFLMITSGKVADGAAQTTVELSVRE
jgi:hypothetical protein